MTATKLYIPMGRFWRALELCDLLDASGITSGVVSEMIDSQWGMLAAAAGLRRAPSLLTRNLTIEILRSREDTRSMLKRRTTYANANEAPDNRQVIQIQRS